MTKSYEKTLHLRKHMNGKSLCTLIVIMEMQIKVILKFHVNVEEWLKLIKFIVPCVYNIVE